MIRRNADVESAAAERYRHAQIGHVMIAALGAGVAFVGVMMAVAGFNWVLLAALALVAAALALMPTQTVIVDDGAVRVRMGPGVFRRTVPLSRIASCRIVRTPWYYGYGIRLIPRGWLYRVSGLMAVEVTLDTGRTCRIGTDQPDQLLTALLEVLGPRGGPT